MNDFNWPFYTKHGMPDKGTRAGLRKGVSAVVNEYEQMPTLIEILAHSTYNA